LKNRLSWLLLGLCTAVASTAHAGGFYVGVKGAQASGRGGAFTAKADDLSAVALNPAGLARIDGWFLHAGNRFSNNSYEFTRAPTPDYAQVAEGMPAPVVSFSAVQNERPWQLLDPIIGLSSDFDTKNFTFALVSYAPAGVAAQEYPIDGGQRYMMVKMEALMIHHTLNVAWSASDDLHLGASLQWIFVPQLDYQLVIDGNIFANVVNPVSSPTDIKASVEGSDTFTPNLVLGALYEASESIELGLAAQVLPADIETESTLALDLLAPGQPDPTLSRDSVATNDVSLKVPLPLSIRAGIRYVAESFDVELDVAYQTWSRAERFSLLGDGLEAVLSGQQVPVDQIHVEKHWEDTIGVSLGGDVEVAPDLFTARAGLFYETAAAPPAYSNVDALVGESMGGALGASLHFGSLELVLSHEQRVFPEYAVTEAESGVFQQVPGSACVAPYTDPAFCRDEILGQPSVAANAGTYSAHVHATSLDVLYKF
jgi:long-subunit fatty acid transport protein